MKALKIIFLMVLTFPLMAAASINLSNDAPKVGETITLNFSDAIDSLVISYRPNSAVVKREVLNFDPATNSAEWTPKNPGVVALAYTSGGTTVSKNVSIRFDGLSYPGILVMILAGIVLFGGAITAFRTLFRDEEEDGTIDFDPDHLPDT